MRELIDPPRRCRCARACPAGGRGHGTTPSRTRDRRRAGDAQEGRQGAVAGLPARACGCRAAAGRLRRVRPHRRPLGPGVPAHVDPVGDLGAGGEGPLERRRVELVGEAVDPADRANRPHDGVAGHGRLEDPRACRRSRRPARRPRARARGRGGRSRRWRRRRGAGRPARCAARAASRSAASSTGARQNRVSPGDVGLGLGPAAAVGVAEPLDPGHPERLGGPARLLQPALAEAAVAAQLVGRQARAAVGREHEDDAVALGRGACHRARGEQRLVVGVGVEGHDREGHRRPSSRMAGCRPREGRHAHRLLPAAAGRASRARCATSPASSCAPGTRSRCSPRPTGPHGERGGATTTGDDGVTVHRLAIPLPGGIPVNPFAPREVRRRLAAGGFDVAHAHLGVVSPFATELVPVALGAGLPVTATFHCVIDRSTGVFRARGSPRPLGRARRRPQRRVEDGGCPRVGGRPRCRRRGGAQRRGCRVVAAGDRAPAPRLARAGIRCTSCRRCAWSPASGRSATLAVLRGARAILDPAVPLRATIVGEGPQRRLMERYLRTHGLDWVELPGRVDKRGAAPAAPGRPTST